MKLKTLVGLLVVTTQSSAYFPINLFKPHDRNTYRYEVTPYGRFDVCSTFEFAASVKGRTIPDPVDDQSCDVDVMRIWQPDQNALTMLKGFETGSEIASLAQQLNVSSDDGVRGHICFSGDLSVPVNALFSARWMAGHDVTLGVYVPVVSMKLCTSFSDRTKLVTADDIATRNLLTNNLAANVKRLGGLDITGWKRSGLGDVVFMADWLRNFPQDKLLLSNVTTRLRVGATLPTGKRTNPHEIFSIPLGYDGAFGFIAGAALDLLVAPLIQVGVDVEILYLLSAIADRRIKTDRNQSDLLLLARASAIKDYGFSHRFNLYAELYRFWQGLTFNVTYQCFRHNDDRLTLVDNAFSSELANTARSLQEWSMHHVIYRLGYDGSEHFSESKVNPYFTLFYKQPINGKNALLAHTLGFTAAVTF